MDEQYKFKKMVTYLAELDFHGNNDICDAICDFENKIEELGLGNACFGIARSNWDAIDIIRPYYNSDYKFYAEYYDGFQAPFIVCEWKDEFEKLEELLKNTSETLYKKYKEYLEKED